MPSVSANGGSKCYCFIAVCLVVVMGMPAAAVTPITPVSVESCDAFLAAYAQCVASPSVPDAVRPNIRQGINTLRESFREALARNEASRPIVAYQCAQAHESVRQSMVDAFKCEFPALPPASQVLLQSPPPTATTTSTGRAPVRPAPSPPSLEAQEVAKVNAYTEAQNHLVRSHPLARQLAEYRRDNERVLKLGTKLGANAWYHFGIVDFDGVIDELEKATALPSGVPEVDPPAAWLLASLRELNPTLKALTRYQTTREFKEDGYKFAREQHPILVIRVEAAAKAMDAYGTALFERELVRDERRAAAMPQDAPARRLLATSLALRRAVQRFEALGPRADVAPFLAALGEVGNANRQLGATFDGMSPKANSSCTGYADTVASVIGHGRDMARDIRAKGDPSQPARLFNDTYNRSVRDLESCQRYEIRARPS
ncbi:DUF3829 domain-containing protein [Methylobacterium sp. WL30]|uniref:DUF3829 domain-containing protein n=1 Tax=unclassified Methylobacterium TaxID=2615210 RepID=UPI0011CBE3D8|nr:MULTISPECIES: DUF3829 domain-containing protein [unclassified Methylobacterium]TXM92678.1 DUF3829 domain-containing protein [Methylobacterium sp. WL116]TXN41539.1 DUF3829 domain-containing protein [Methylobacterium sp. WL93]TXN52453.1 DUF3829 domain-containing protein [Methylobacterium sp. WL119]TXN69744.1 DUF3829 domain-containing protein [Methylobacterium sp. WL30]